MGQRLWGLLTTAGNCLGRNQIFLTTLPRYKIQKELSGTSRGWSQPLRTYIKQKSLTDLPPDSSRCDVLQQAERRRACGSAPACFTHVPGVAQRSGEYAISLFLTEAALGCTKQIGPDRKSPDTCGINLQLFQNKTWPLWTEITGDITEHILLYFL